MKDPVLYVANRIDAGVRGALENLDLKFSRIRTLAVWEYITGVFHTNSGDIAQLNGLRVIAIFSVFLFHLHAPMHGFLQAGNPYLFNFFTNMNQGVDVFFVLSGFLISRPLFRELNRSGTVKIGVFYAKRFFRIFPPYYIFLGLQVLYVMQLLAEIEPYIMLPQARAQYDLIKGMWLDPILFDVTYLSNYFPGTMAHGWSLSIEEQFYILLPFLLVAVFARIPDRWRIFSLFVFFIAPVCFRFIAYQEFVAPAADVDRYQTYLKTAYYPLHTRFDGLATGMLAAYILDYRPAWIESFTEHSVLRPILHVGAWLSIFCVTFLVNEGDGSFFSTVLRFSVLNLCWVIILLITLRPASLVGRVLGWKPLTFLARLSYAAYITHVIVGAHLVPKLFPVDPTTGQPFEPVTQMDLLVWYPFVAMYMMGAAYLFHLVAERPFMLLRARLFPSVHQ